MKEDLIIQSLARIEGKVDLVARDNSQTRESLAGMRERLASVAGDVTENKATLASHEVEIKTLKGFRSRILGAVAAGGALGGIVAAVVAALTDWFAK